jgi:PAS domain S-box-containing protein
MLALDPDGYVVTWNSGAERAKGYAAPEIVGRHFSVFYPPEDVRSGKPHRELMTAASDGRLEDEGWRLRKDGTRFWANVVITALRDRDGTLLGYGTITRDLTERHALGLEVREREHPPQWRPRGGDRVLDHRDGPGWHDHRVQRRS